MSDEITLPCPTCNREMSELSKFEGLWSCPKCRKVWIEQFESDFKFDKPKKTKFECPGCESNLFKAKDEKGKETFIFCQDCGGIQLTHKQTFLFNDEQLSEEVKKSFQKKAAKKKSNKKVKEKVSKVVEKEKKSGGKENIFIKLIFTYGYVVTFFVTLLAVLPAGIWFGVFGTDRLLQFSQIPYLESFPLVITFMLIIIPGALISLKQVKAAKIGLFFYFICMHAYLVWGLSPAIKLVVDYDFYMKAQVVDKNNDGVEDAINTLFDERAKRGSLAPDQVPQLIRASQFYYAVINEFYRAPHPFAYLHQSDFASSALNKKIQTFYLEVCKKNTISKQEKISLLRIFNTSSRNSFVKDNKYLIPIDTSNIFVTCN
jgi:hypothetical protein